MRLETQRYLFDIVQAARMAAEITKEREFSGQHILRSAG